MTAPDPWHDHLSASWGQPDIVHWPYPVPPPRVSTARAGRVSTKEHAAFSGVSGPGRDRQTRWSAQASCGPPNTSDYPTTSKGCCISEGSACLSSCQWHSSFTSECSVVPESFVHQLGIPAEVPPDSEHTTKCALSPRFQGGGRALMERGWVWTLRGAHTELWPPRCFSQNPSLVHRSPGHFPPFQEKLPDLCLQ